MNYLAHLYLSGTSEDLLIGNFIADSVKGKQYEQHPEEVQKGILLHRKIDTFTDQHPVVEKSKARLRSKYHKYAGVIVDIYYDHFLAVHWDEHSSLSLADYAQTIYTLLGNKIDMLPEKSAMFYGYMKRYDILNAYAKIEGVNQVLYGMSRRATFVSNMELATDELQEHYQLFEEEFRKFFAELKWFVEGQLERPI